MQASLKRWLVLSAMLAASVAAAMHVSDGDAPTPAAAQRARGTASSPPRNAAQAPAMEAIQALRQDRPARAYGEMAHDPFAPKQWSAPVPIAPVPVAPTEFVGPLPKPSPPPLPFSYMGRMQEEGGKWTIYLARGDAAYSVTPGEVLDGKYRVESLTDSQIEFTYLPLSEKQILTIPGSS